MLDRPVVSFDIETIPDFDVGRRILGIEGTDAEVVREMVRRRREDTNGSSDYPQLPWHRVVCACATIVDPVRKTAEIRALGGDAFDERSHVSGFFGLVGEAPESPRIVSWNGNGFDLPVLRYRAMKLGVVAPGFYRADADGNWNPYGRRYENLHVDVMDVLSGHGASSRAGLSTIARLLDLPDKSFLERTIYDHVLEGDFRRVVEYCKLDTVLTMLVFLKWALHTGSGTESEIRTLVDSVREAIARQPFEGWRDITASLTSWPSS